MSSSRHKLSVVLAVAALASGVPAGTAHAMVARDRAAVTTSSALPARVDGIGIRPAGAPSPAAGTVERVAPAPAAGSGHDLSFGAIGASVVLALALLALLLHSVLPTTRPRLRPAGRERA